MRTSSAFVLALALLPVGCRSKTAVVPLTPPGQSFDPIPADSVFVFSSADRVLPTYQRLARIYVGFSYSTSQVGDEERLEEKLRKRAGKLGAHGIILEEGNKVPEDVYWGGMPSGSGLAIRFPEPGNRPESLPARSPSEMRAIAVAPVVVPPDVHLPDSVAAAFDEDIRQWLRENGYHALPPGLFDSMRGRMGEDIQPSVDPVGTLKITGGDSRERLILKALVEEQGADGFLIPEIQGAEATFDGEAAMWDGTEQTVGETRSLGAKIISGILNLFRTGEHDFSEDEPAPEGSVWALSLVIRIENSIGARLYTGRGGIELLEKADFEGGIWFGDPEPEGYQIVRVPEEELFQKRNRIRRSVRIALEPLLPSPVR